MSAFIRRPLVAVLACAALVAFAAPSIAATVNMKANLKGSSEVPPNDSKGTGSVDVTYDTASGKLSWKGTYSGLSGPATAAHFHIAEVGKNGSIAIPIFAGAMAKSPFEGSATLNASQTAALNEGKFYVNVHTANHKGGEIRGQVTK
jgi:CHRD domain.